MKILVVDDDIELLQAVQLMLEDSGHRVETTTDPLGAVTKVQDNGYDLVLVDYKMPERDGVWFMKHVNLPAHTKVLLITAYVNREAIKQMFELGASGYIIKPFGPDDLNHHINYFTS